MTTDYFKLSPEKLNQLKRLNNELSMTDLIALVAMAGLANTAAYCVDVVECGDCTPDEVPNDAASYASCAIDMMTDMINEHDLNRMIEANNLADDFIVEFEQRYVAVKK